MNAIELLQDKIIRQFPDAQVDLDRSPHIQNGQWFLDVIVKNKHIVIEWRPKQGFGISNCSEPGIFGYGEGPDKVFRESDAVFAEIIRLLTT